MSATSQENIIYTEKGCNSHVQSFDFTSSLKQDTSHFMSNHTKASLTLPTHSRKRKRQRNGKRLDKGGFRFVFHLNSKSFTEYMVLNIQKPQQHRNQLSAANKLKRQNVTHQILSLNNNTILSAYNTLNNTSIAFILAPNY